MPSLPDERTNFAAGQIDEAARKDVSRQFYKAAVASGRNMRIRNGGSLIRRGGSWQRATLMGQSIACDHTTKDGSPYKFIFSASRLDIYDANNNLDQTLSGQPWTASRLADIYFGLFDGKFSVSHNEFPTRIISLDDTSGNWSAADFAFADAAGGGLAQPYYRYEAKLITLRPSALTGSITLTASTAIFVKGATGHINTYVRYLGFPILITNVGSGTGKQTTATGTPVTTLPSTVTLTVVTSLGFGIDLEIKGEDTNSTAVVTAIPDSTHITCVYTTGITGFSNTERVTAANGSLTTISAIAAATPAAVVNWDEQAFSSVRGYPGGSGTHAGRFYFWSMRDLPRGVTASAAGFPDYFQVGANDGDAIFELAPDFKGQRVRHIVDAAQGLVLTDKASYFLPEFGAQPITPSNIGFKQIAAIGASKARPVETSIGGIAFIEEGTNRVMAINPTGNVQTPWDSGDLSGLWSEIIPTPISLGSDVNTTGRPERYSYAVNSDGTLACAKVQPVGSDIPVGWLPWDTDGDYKQIFSAGGKQFAIVVRSINDVDTWLLEEFDETLLVDGAVAFTTGGNGQLNKLKGHDVQIFSGTAWFRGTFGVSSNGSLQNFPLASGSYVGGLAPQVEFEPTAPFVEHPAFRHGREYAIPECYLHVEDTGAYYANDILVPAYRAGESLDVAPALRTEAKLLDIPGEGADLQVSIVQPSTLPQPLHVVAVAPEVAF